MKVINNYQITLYKGLGVTGWKALLLLGVYTSWAAVMNWVNALLLDRFGRIKLMTFGMVRTLLFFSVIRYPISTIQAFRIFN
jgi:hypothetical protein